MYILIYEWTFCKLTQHIYMQQVTSIDLQPLLDTERVRCLKTKHGSKTV